MAKDNRDQLGRRTFINRMAFAAGASSLSPVFGTPSQAAEEANDSRHIPSPGATKRLAEYAASLRYEDIPQDVRRRVVDAIADTAAVIMYGGKLEWSKIVIAHAQRTGPNGKSAILGAGNVRVQAPSAALAHGTMAHAFEMDNLTDPDSGSHPGASMFSAGLAIAQERGLSGKDLVTAMAAGAEVMIRVGRAAQGTLEPRGFHAPGTTGPFGGAVAGGKLLGFDATKIANAIGIAGSLSGGLLEFTRSNDGAMVKKLHLGRAAESGVLAASLAADGFTGPSSVLEGQAGYLHAFCDSTDATELVKDLGREFVARDIMMKRFACHITAHRPVEAMLNLRAEHKFTAADVKTITITGNQRMATTNNIPAPPDVLLAQYSIPFSVALSLYRNPVDPDSFDDNVAKDRQILAMAQRVKMLAAPGQTREQLTSLVAVELNDGRTVSTRVQDFLGTPKRPFDRAGLKEKFMLNTKRFPQAQMERMFDRLQNIENEPNLDWLTA
jgi:2-methylcitrate dehydratase PrpD